MPGSASDQGPKLGSRGPKMRQNHPETSLIPSHITPKHIPKLFLVGDFSPQVPKKRLSPQTPPLMVLGTYRPHKIAKTSMGPSCATPKPVRGCPCEQPSAWMPRTVSQDTAQSLWDPTIIASIPKHIPIFFRVIFHPKPPPKWLSPPPPPEGTLHLPA